MEIIMNKIRLIITGSVVLALAVIIVVYAFWPAEAASRDELKDVERIQEKDRADLEAQPKPHHQEAEKIYQIALFRKESNDSPDMSYTIVLDCCRLILEQYPNTAQAEKAEELLRQYDMTDRQISRLYSSGPAVKKSRSLRRRSRRRDDEWHIAANIEANPSN
jgi:hypothetical protein